MDTTIGITNKTLEKLRETRKLMQKGKIGQFKDYRNSQLPNYYIIEYALKNLHKKIRKTEEEKT